MEGIGGTEIIVFFILVLVGIFALFGFKQFFFKVNETAKQPIRKDIKSDDKFDKLKELKSLLDNDVLTKEEFENEKKKLLK